MGLGRLFTSRLRPGPVESRVITEFAVIDGVAVDGSGEAGTRYRGAMSIPGAWRASILISDLLGGVPWHSYEQVPGSPLRLIDPEPPLLAQPSPPDPRVATISSLALDLIWHGNAVGVWATRDGQGTPTAVVPVSANEVGVRRVTSSEWSPLPVGSIEYSIGGRSYGSSEVLHIKGPAAPGSLRGMGVLESHMTGGALGLATEQMRQANSLSRHGVPTGVLKMTNPDATWDELRAAKDQWLANQRDRTVSVLNATTDFVPLSWNPEQLQLVEARRYTLTDLELIFGLPVGWLGGQNSSRQYSNIEQDAVNLLKFSLSGHVARFEQTLTLAMPSLVVVKADLDAVLRADTLTRYQAHAIALSSGFLSVDEVREIEDRAPLSEPVAPVVEPVDDPEEDVPDA